MNIDDEAAIIGANMGYRERTMGDWELKKATDLTFRFRHDHLQRKEAIPEIADALRDVRKRTLEEAAQKALLTKFERFEEDGMLRVTYRGCQEIADAIRSLDAPR